MVEQHPAERRPNQHRDAHDNCAHQAGSGRERKSLAPRHGLRAAGQAREHEGVEGNQGGPGRSKQQRRRAQRTEVAEPQQTCQSQRHALASQGVHDAVEGEQAAEAPGLLLPPRQGRCGGAPTVRGPETPAAGRGSASSPDQQRDDQARGGREQRPSAEDHRKPDAVEYGGAARPTPPQCHVAQQVLQQQRRQDHGEHEGVLGAEDQADSRREQRPGDPVDASAAQGGRVGRGVGPPVADERLGHQWFAEQRALEAQREQVDGEVHREASEQSTAPGAPDAQTDRQV